ncbi:hypothetical protein ATCVGM07011_657R [Acanthocystis turfacea Chlorella virus GM0701.1]|nr:hypothetical protein ATCVGM07011_657R [Acanthocystis turfacea Chlorella virus GM0701.1]
MWYWLLWTSTLNANVELNIFRVSASEMKIGETILFSIVAGLAVALILSTTIKKEPADEPSFPSTVIIEEVE